MRRELTLLAVTLVSSWLSAGSARAADDAGTAPALCTGHGANFTLPQATRCRNQAKEDADNALTDQKQQEKDLLAANQAVTDKQKAVADAQAAANAPGATEDAKKKLATAKDELDKANAALKEAQGQLDTAKETSKQANQKLADLQKQLDEMEEIAADPSAVFAAYGCGDPLTICLMSDGTPLTVAESVPTEAIPGDILTVKIFVLNAQSAQGVSATVTFSQRQPADTMFDKGQAGASQRLFDIGKRKNPDLVILDNVYTSTAVTDEASEFVIQVSQTSGDKRISTRSFVIAVNHGHSYYSIALLVAATYRGERVIHRDLTQTSDTTLEGAFALNIFPGGRRRGVIGYLVDCQGKRCWADTFGLQLGTDLDLSTPFDRVFAGIVFEPVSGLAFSTGVSVRQVAFITADSDRPGIVNSTTPIPTELRRVIRPYVGVTFTFDLLDTLAKVKLPTRPGS